MHKEYAKKFYNSKQWRECRESYINKVYGLCEHCNDPGYIVDHIEEINIDNINDVDILLNHDNLQYLCTPCHNKKTFRTHEPLAEGYTFDDQGNLTEV